MKTKFLVLIIGAALLIALARLLPMAKEDANEAAPSGADTFRIEAADYAPLVKAATAGDCDSAFTLARYHGFYTTKFDESVRWYRVAARCPHLNAKRELLSMLQDLPEHDDEVDRLLAEIELLNPKFGADDRRDIASARANR